MQFENMKVLNVGVELLKEQIDGEVWVFTVTEVFHLSPEEFAKNEAYNDTLGDYEPEKELPTNSEITITATSSKRDNIILKWSYPEKGIYPHVSKKGWSKGLFIKLNQILSNWVYPNA